MANLESVLPALREGRTIMRTSEPNRHIVLGEANVLWLDPTNDINGGPLMLVTADLEADDWEVVAEPRQEGHADANARGQTSTERPHPGFGGRYDVKKLGRPDARLEPSKNRTRYFVPHTENEVCQIDGEWFFADPALPRVDEDGKAHAKIIDETQKQ